MVEKIHNLAKVYRHEDLRTTIQVCWNVLQMGYQKGVLGKRYVTKKVNGYRMYLDLNDRGISRTLALFGTREKDQIYILEKELKPGMVVLDIGSNIGSYALLEAGIVGCRGKVYAVEPAPDNFGRLNANVMLNRLDGIIQTFQLGISNRQGVQKLFLSESSNLHTFCLEEFSVGKRGESREKRTIDVETVSISDFRENKRQIDFIRMDIEGYEIEAFQGMLSALKKGGFSPMVLFETHRPKYNTNDRNIRDILEKLFSFGYFVKTIISNDEPKGKFRERGYQPTRLIKSDFVMRGIYDHVSEEDALYFISDAGYVRAVLLAREHSAVRRMPVD